MVAIAKKIDTNKMDEIVNKADPMRKSMIHFSQTEQRTPVNLF